MKATRRISGNIPDTTDLFMAHMRKQQYIAN